MICRPRCVIARPGPRQPTAINWRCCCQPIAAVAPAKFQHLCRAACSDSWHLRMDLLNRSHRHDSSRGDLGRSDQARRPHPGRPRPPAPRPTRGSERHRPERAHGSADEPARHTGEHATGRLGREHDDALPAKSPADAPSSSRGHRSLTSQLFVALYRNFLLRSPEVEVLMETTIGCGPSCRSTKGRADA
jgi:hypothetical protein